MPDIQKYSDFLNERCLKGVPALSILLGILNGIVPLLVTDSPNPLNMLFSFPFFLLSFFLLKKDFAVKAALFTIIGILLVYYHKHLPEDHYANLISKQNCGAEIEVLVTDTSCVNDEIKWIPNPVHIKTELLRMRYNEPDSWREATGKLAVRLPKDAEKVHYGDRLIIKGFFSEPDGTLFHGDFDFRNYLEARGIKMIFQSWEYKESENRDIPLYASLFRTVLDFRNKIILINSAGIEKIENRQILGALIFGCRQALPWESRETFIRSGTVHIFTVSGFHVGMLTLALFWILRWIPFKIRYYMVPFLILIFVLTTGFQPSAVRALLMISLWSFCRARLYISSPLNIVFLAAALILIFNPVCINDIGFQYSFVTVGFLVGSTGAIQRWTAGINEKNSWIVSSQRGTGSLLFYKYLRVFFVCMAGCVIAWLASSGITLYHQGIYIPLASLANFFLIPFAWLIFVFSGIKILLYPLTFLLPLINTIIESTLDCISGICALFADFSPSGLVSTPPLWSLPIFYVLIFMIMSAKHKKVFISSLAALFLLMAFWHIKQGTKNMEAAVLYGGDSQEPSIIIANPVSKKALLVNIPSWTSARTVSNYLSSRGISRIETLFICENRKAFCHGAPPLCSDFKVERIVLPETYKRSHYAKETVKAAQAAGIKIELPEYQLESTKYWTFDSGTLEASSTKDAFSFEYTVNGIKISLEILNENNGTRSLILGIPGRERRILKFENTNKCTLKELKI